MARYTGPVCRLCRREGIKLFLKAERCYQEKCPMNKKRNYPPGLHGQSRKSKVSEYGIQLREKQKARRAYGILEGQFRRYFHKAQAAAGVTGENLLQLLERRLDNVTFRLGLGGSRPEARQMVRHGHIRVNGRKVSIPSFIVRVGDRITLRSESREKPRFKELLERGGRMVPEWLSFQPEAAEGTVLRLPQREEIDLPIEEHLIVELYSR